MINLAFSVCAAFLDGFGRIFKLTYQEISVIFNLWLQGALLTLSAIAPLIASIVTLTQELSVKSWCLVVGFSVYALIYVIGFIAMLWHYRLPYMRAFALCIDDLQKLADRLGTSYAIVNLVIFIVIFMALVIGNILMTIAVL